LTWLSEVYYLLTAIDLSQALEGLMLLVRAECLKLSGGGLTEITIDAGIIRIDAGLQELERR